MIAQQNQKPYIIIWWPLIAFAVVHTTAVVWWASRIDERLRMMPEDRKREFAIRDERIMSLDKKVDTMERVLTGSMGEVKTSVLRIESKIDRYILDDRKINGN